MFEIVEFRKEHILPMMGQPLNADIANWFENGHAETMEKVAGPCASTILINGVPAVCGGLIEYWPNRGYLWCVLNEEFKGNFVPVFRGIKEFLRRLNCRRLEMAVPVDFKPGQRRAELLGFTVECPCAKSFFANGQDGVLYAMVRE